MRLAVPAAAMIESACDMQLDDATAKDALHELEESAPKNTVLDFNGGYLLGLQTGAVMVIEGAWSKETLMLGLQPEVTAGAESMPVPDVQEAKREEAEITKEGAPVINAE